MIVLDASAATAIAFGTDEGRAMATFILKDERIIAPALLHAELAHVFGKYANQGLIDEASAQSKLDDVLLLVDDFISDRELYGEAYRESRRLGHSSYDMFYFILARRTGATLFTLDRKLIELCLDNGVDCLYESKVGAKAGVQQA